VPLSMKCHCGQARKGLRENEFHNLRIAMTKDWRDPQSRGRSTIVFHRLCARWFIGIAGRVLKGRNRYENPVNLPAMTFQKIMCASSRNPLESSTIVFHSSSRISLHWDTGSLPIAIGIGRYDSFAVECIKKSKRLRLA
jgi:hypothetical protein